MRGNDSHETAPEDALDVIDLDELFSLLAAERRRRALRALSRRSDSTTVEALVATMADGECESEIHTALHHAHLPRLADAGAVEFDPDDGVLVLTDRGDALLTVLDRVLA